MTSIICITDSEWDIYSCVKVLLEVDEAEKRNLYSALEINQLIEFAFQGKLR